MKCKKKKKKKSLWNPAPSLSGRASRSHLFNIFFIDVGPWHSESLALYVSQISAVYLRWHAVQLSFSWMSACYSGGQFFFFHISSSELCHLVVTAYGLCHDFLNSRQPPMLVACRLQCPRINKKLGTSVCSAWSHCEIQNPLKHAVSEEHKYNRC